MSDEAIAGKPPKWLFDEYDRVERARWRITVETITATEMGVLRALDRGFNGPKSRVRDLPSYDELMQKNAGPERNKPAWMEKFEEVNRERLAKPPQSEQ